MMAAVVLSVKRGCEFAGRRYRSVVSGWQITIGDEAERADSAELREATYQFNVTATGIRRRAGTRLRSSRLCRYSASD